jgi:hypothetical protein
VTIHLTCLLNIRLYMKRILWMWKCRLKVSFLFFTLHHQVLIWELHCHTVFIHRVSCQLPQHILQREEPLKSVVSYSSTFCVGNSEWNQSVSPPSPCCLLFIVLYNIFFGFSFLFYHVCGRIL